MLTVHTIVSGGQSGADQAGLRAAKIVGLETGGFCPPRCLTENGPRPELIAEYGLMEWPGGYAERTEANAALAEATVIFGLSSPGTSLTERCCEAVGRPWVRIADPRDIAKVHQLRMWLHGVKPGVLNCAGNRETRNPGIYHAVIMFLITLFKLEQP